MDTTLDIFGRTLHIDVRHQQLYDWLHTYWDFGHRDVMPNEFAIKLTERSAEEMSARLAQAHQWPRRDTPTTVPGHTMTIYQQGERWLIGGVDWGVAFDVNLADDLDEGADVAITVWGTEQRLDHYTLFLAVGEALRVSGLMSLHAAAAATPDGRVTAFLGPSGRGKTSTLLRAVEAGWAPVSEDMLWLEPSTLRVYGGEKGVRLLPEVLATLPAELAERDWGAPVVDKVLLPYDALETHYQTTRKSGLRLTRVASLERNPDAPVDTSYWQPLPKREATLALWQASGLPLTRQARVTIATTIPKLLRDTDVGQLHLGRSDVRDFLAALLHGPPVHGPPVRS